ncbi:uncharacterized protein ASPGLDRAFT_39638 [Aspergillus glaucus CBS 516.65]|uniref:Uncharacterized protein n=1 Tax=Aspergillus glaucus CBS 516.65 TaxID=1160497 RepID=A0A1L9V7G4_ASPGL|nr:hypothetical protein ASPGLDRAFT_39638 [Aspergillus glaucus CBS 516.65]OJJ79782.1 hypothetical protein ASPGLDRAFT_39638 [Aspergillus glaucus CBS 516.65]
MVTAAALPVNKIPKPPSLTLSVASSTKTNARVECFPGRTCDTGTCYHGYCYVDEEDIPWDDEDKPNNIDNGDSDNDNDNDNGDIAKHDGF